MKINHLLFPLKYILICLLLQVGSVVLHAQDNDAKGFGKAPKKLDTISVKRYALVIGLSSSNNIHKLNYAHNDAMNFANLLKRGYLGIFEEIKVLVEQNASYDSITQAVFLWLNDLTTIINPNDQIYIYFSGHGVV